MEYLYAKCRFQILTVQKCHIYARYGSHTEAELAGIVKSDAAKRVLADTSQEKLEIFACDASGTKKLLFVGVISEIMLEEEGDYASINLKALSYTLKMDIQKKSRSFQFLDQTYRDVAEIILREYDAEISWDIPDRRLEYPLIQYNETDYRFLKRILSYIGAGITSEDTVAKIYLKAGIKTNGKRAELDLGKYHYTLQAYKSVKAGSGMREGSGYEVEEMEGGRIGDAYIVRGKVLYVMAMRTVLEKGILRSTCWLFPERCFKEKKIGADTLKGAILSGVIVGAQAESVKMKLDIDQKQNKEEACEFPWRPITGNFLYCAPELGTKAALYFGRAEENSAEVVCSIRENGEECAELEDYQKRYFTTAKNKRMQLMPSDIRLSNMGEKNVSVSLEDEAGVSVKADDRMSIMAEGKVTLKGKNVIVSAVKEATIVRKDVLASTVINLCNAFDAIGKNGGFTAVQQKRKKKKKVTTNYRKNGRYSLDGAVETVLSNIPAEGGQNSALNMIAAGMPLISK